MPNDNALQFPRRFRLAPEPATAYRPGEAAAAVIHDGRIYPLERLLCGLTPDELKMVAQSAPRTGQDVWDSVVRLWPALADEIAAKVGPAG